MKDEQTKGDPVDPVEMTEVDTYVLDRLNALESCDRGIKREEDDFSDVRKEFNGRIAELKKARNQILSDLHDHRLGIRGLPMGPPVEREPGEDDD